MRFSTSFQTTDIDSDPDIDEVYIKVFEAGQSPICEITYGDDGNDFVSLPTEADKYYTIYIEVDGASGATAGHTPSVDLEIKVESP
jgi:hypothetical protein